MPAVEREYEYYEYKRQSQGAVKNAVPRSSVRKNTTARKVTPTKVQSKNLKTTTTRDVTKNATRIATRDDNFIGTKRKVKSQNTVLKSRATSKKTSLDPVVFNNKKTLKKPQEMTLTKPKHIQSKREVEKQKAKVKEMFRNIVLGSLIFGMFFLICYRYSLINEAFNDLNDLKSEVKNKQTVNAQLEKNIKENTDLSYIENYAKYQLGMQKPKDSQIQKVCIGKQDKIILPIEIEEEKEEGLMEKLAKDIRKILD